MTEPVGVKNAINMINRTVEKAFGPDVKKSKWKVTPIIDDGNGKKIGTKYTRTLDTNNDNIFGGEGDVEQTRYSYNDGDFTDTVLYGDRRVSSGNDNYSGNALGHPDNSAASINDSKNFVGTFSQESRRGHAVNYERGALNEGKLSDRAGLFLLGGPSINEEPIKN